MNKSVCTICRRQGEKLYLKGARCFGPSCSFNRRPYPPGRLDTDRKHRSVVSEYGNQLKEKQKVRNMYGVSEHQFKSYVRKIVDGNYADPAMHLYETLEKRLDNVVFRLGLAPSRAAARQAVIHGHITVNGRRVNIPSFLVSVGQVVAVRKESLSSGLFKEISSKDAGATPSPVWLSFDAKNHSGVVKSAPLKGSETLDLNTVLEFYSRS